MATTSTMGLEHYSLAVETAREYIFAGDAFQVVLSQRFDFDLGADAFDAYRVLRQVNPSPYMYFLRHHGLEVVGGSPEPMVQLLDGKVISRPIAGTRRRGRTDAEDRRLGAELAEHPKEVAEHVMLVDLARNDVGRVVEFGTLNLDEMMTLERYSHVMHLTSQVSGRLAQGATPIDVLRATLPAGTVSGAPKVRGHGRSSTSWSRSSADRTAGVVGYIDFSGNIDTAITIPHHARARRPGVGPGRRRHRGRLGGRGGARRVREQGQGPAGRGRCGPAHDRGPQQGPQQGAPSVTAVAALASRDAVLVTGTDAAPYLQGQISQDVEAVAPGTSAWSLVLAPQGKVDAWFRLTRRDDGSFVLDVDAGFGEVLTSRLERFRLRVDVSFESLKGWRMLSARGDAAKDPRLDAVHAEVRAAVTWPGFSGIDLLGPDVRSPVGLTLAGADDWEVARIRAGWPAMGCELTERTIPAEVGGLLESSVSFTKAATRARSWWPASTAGRQRAPSAAAAGDSRP